ncbi:hypothetical protein D9758_002258 [Tetrapyrgos nigripes]|uniref:Hemimethylated DNA-binding domain-containing protein n=1 Tax=Tetrapyrgos nigripes TaxID=182062 RepID=A0A8H5GNP7_9AGAR|nr:hypothetical protein D9758_002258 [Tetrapyrgos nigripes]
MTASTSNAPPLGKYLASTDKKTRDKAIKNLSTFLSDSSQDAIPKPEMIKLWKGIFYCFWMSDKPLVQQALASELAEIVLTITTTTSSLGFLSGFWETIVREWNGIDRLRMDKYYMLVRRFVNASFRLLIRENWDVKIVEEYNKILCREGGPLNPADQRVPSSLPFHLSDIYLEELDKAIRTTSEDSSISPAPLKHILMPFLQLAARTNAKTTYKHLESTLLEPLLSSLSSHEDLDDEVRSRKRRRLNSGSNEEDLPYSALISNSCFDGPSSGALPAPVLKKKLLKGIFEVASEPETKDPNRRKLSTIRIRSSEVCTLTYDVESGKVSTSGPLPRLRLEMFPQLPLDILIVILEQLPASRDIEGEISAQVLGRCAQANDLFRDAAYTLGLWESHYNARYHYSDESAELQRQTQFGNNYRLRYIARRTIDRRCLDCLDKIVEERRGRYDHATTIARMCLDAWDVLDIEMRRCNRPLVFCRPDEKLDATLTREYWAGTMIKAILRTHAVRLWSNIVLQGSDTVSFVDALSAISCFVGKGPKEVYPLLDSLIKQCRDFLNERGCPTSPEDSGYSLPDICSHICEFLRSQGFGPVEAPNFHNMANLFPHSYLTTNKKTIPLSLVHVFVAIARGLGIAASPVAFPMRVIAHVSSPDPSVDDFYVDVFGSEDKAILSLRRDIPVLLARQGVLSPVDHISPCLATPMLLRTGRNILAALHTAVRVSNSMAKDAILTAFSIHLLLTRSEPLIGQMFSQVDALDVATFISEALVPGIGQSHISHHLSSACQEIMSQEVREAAVVRLRSEEETSIQHFVGLVFQHKIYSYTGCVYGWDPICLATDEWIAEMGIKNLARGKDQPFYSCFCMDGTVRYVAEDNIQPLDNCSREVFEKLKEKIDYLPRYFTGVLMNDEWAGFSRGGLLFHQKLKKLTQRMMLLGRPGWNLLLPCLK